MNHTIDNIYYPKYGDIGDELLVCGSFPTIIKVCEILNCHGIMIFKVGFEMDFITNPIIMKHCAFHAI